jgi:hypothetical protein
MGKAKTVVVDEKRELLRHTVATLAYRGGKAVSDAPDGFDKFSSGETTRTPGQILAHIGDLVDWGVSLTEGKPKWHNSKPLPWEKEVARFYKALKRFDDALAADTPLGYPAEQLFQGPIADAMWHIGQIAMLRRMAGAPIRGENYFKAQIVAGRVGPNQSKKRVEFD